MKVQANQLSSHLKSSLAPCYLVSGDEPLLVDETLDAVRGAAKAAGFVDRDVQVAATGFDWQQLFESGANLSLFSERRIIELRLPTGKPGVKGSKAIVDLLDQLDHELMLIVITPKLDRSNANSKWVKALSAKGVHIPIWPIDVRELPAWISARLRQSGLAADRGAVRIIAERVEGNLLAAHQEVEKLRLILGEGSVTADDVSKAVADSSRFDVFKLSDAALSGDSRRAARIVYGLQHEGVSEVIALWALTKELRILAELANAVQMRQDVGMIMKRNGVWQNRQALLRSCLARHSLGSIHSLLISAAEADATAKGRRRGDPWQLIMNLVFGIASTARRAA
ncbi:MAG: DNA polymerase III subunit delta [Woeseiaceae bacterium]|nr:DNA polymerase III subunit delta [Woeseiaceae bacterium]